MNLWGDGRVFVDPAVRDIASADVARYLGAGLVQDPAYCWGGMDPGCDPAHLMTATPLPAGWHAAITGGQVAYVWHERPDGLADNYTPDGRYWLTSTIDSGAGLLGAITQAIVMYGVGAGVTSVFQAAQAGALASQQAAPAAASTGAPSVNINDVFSVPPESLSADWTIAPEYTFEPQLPGYDPLPPNWTAVPEWSPDLYATPPAAPSYPIPEVTISPAPAGGGSWVTTIRDATGAVREIGTAVLSTVQLVRAFNGQVQPSSAGRVASASTGLVGGARPGVGVAVLTPDGGAVINNGDGTYTVIGPDGSRTVRRYGGSQITTGLPGSSLGGIDTQKLLLYGGAALLAVLALQGSRGASPRR